MQAERRSLDDLVAQVREGLVCERCGAYVGSLAPRRYLPPPYPVALAALMPPQEVEALLGFELHMVARMREGNFVIRHPQRDGRCVSVREWLADEDGSGPGDDTPDGA